MSKSPGAALVVALSLLWSAPAARPQQKPPQQREQEQLAVIRDVVDLVNVLCTVKDRKGRVIASLQQNDFKILEDGKEQRIRLFARESDLPLTIGLLIDSSVSHKRLIPIERDAGLTFLDSMLREKDLAFLISFDTHVELLQDFTGSRELLRRGLDGIRVNAGSPSAIGVGGPFPQMQLGGTHLYDAVYLAATDKLAREVGRKTVIVISDGEDQGSKVKITEAIEAAHKADVVVYGIHLVDYDFYRGIGMFGAGGEGNLKKMAEETGGRSIHVGRPEKLREAFAEISEELRSQYAIGYSSSNPNRDGSFRKLQIKVPGDFRVQSRKGYYALPPG
jgi:VWFA-related protein